MDYTAYNNLRTRDLFNKVLKDLTAKELLSLSLEYQQLKASYIMIADDLSLPQKVRDNALGWVE